MGQTETYIFFSFSFLLQMISHFAPNATRALLSVNYDEWQMGAFVVWRQSVNPTVCTNHSPSNHFVCTSAPAPLMQTVNPQTKTTTRPLTWWHWANGYLKSFWSSNDIFLSKSSIAVVLSACWKNHKALTFSEAKNLGFICRCISVYVKNAHLATTFFCSLWLWKYVWILTLR